MNEPMAECGFGEPHEPHGYVVAINGKPVDMECHGLSLADYRATVEDEARADLLARVDRLEPGNMNGSEPLDAYEAGWGDAIKAVKALTATTTARASIEAPDPHSDAAEVERLLREQAAEKELIFEDLRAILRALGLSDGARPIPAHDVVLREILPAIHALATTAAERLQSAERTGNDPT